MKFRSLITSAALAVAVMVPQVAHADGDPVPFWFKSDQGANSPYDSYQGSYDATTYFQVFCVDPVNHVSTGPIAGGVWVTPFINSENGGADTYASRGISEGATFNSSYLNAAKLASLMAGNHPFGPMPNSDVISLQNAIWYAMGFGNGGEANFNYWMNEYNTSGFAINPANWYVISAFNGTTQEFITFVDTPFETVPEPATMTLLATGLAGMAAARRRRKS